MKTFSGYMKGIGMGSWLTNYKRARILTPEQIGEVSPGDWEHFDTYYTREDVARVASWGMDHIRLPFDQVILEDARKPFTYRERGFQYLDRMLEWCAQEGLNVMLNLHHAVGCYCDSGEKGLFTDGELQERFIRLWEELDKRYKGVDCIFELMNEPTTGDADLWNALAERAVKRLHAQNPGRRIMVGAAGWSNPCHLPRLKTYGDERITYDFHAYFPHEFTHQRAIFSPEMAVYNRVMPYPGDIRRYREYRAYYNLNAQDLEGLDRMDERYIERRMQPVKDFMQAHPDEILCNNEFSCLQHIRLEDRENWYHDIIAFCLRNNIGYSAWNYMHTPYDGTRASLVDERTREILSPRLLRILQGKEP